MRVERRARWPLSLERRAIRGVVPRQEFRGGAEPGTPRIGSRGRLAAYHLEGWLGVDKFHRGVFHTGLQLSRGAAASAVLQRAPDQLLLVCIEQAVLHRNTSPRSIDGQPGALRTGDFHHGPLS